MCSVKGNNRTENTGSLLLSAYPDRVAGARGEGVFQLANGSNARLPITDSLSHESYLVIPSLGGIGSVPKIFLACAISEEEILACLKESLRWSESLEFNDLRKKFFLKRQLKLGHLVLKEEKSGQISKERYHEALQVYLSENGLSKLNWSKEVLKFRDRVNFLYSQDIEGFSDCQESSLVVDLKWLTPFFSGMSQKSSLADIPLMDALKARLSWQALKELDKLAPTHFTVPSGSRIPIDYSGKEPVLKVRIQELFGLIETPILCRGKSPLIIHLLSPASRPIQITKDLENFWENTYSEVKKDLKGRYPRHYWPEDPFVAQATNRVKKKL